MLMIKERVKKLISELHQYIYSDSKNIEHYKIIEGSFKGGEALDLDIIQWSDFHITDRWGGYDKDFWFRTDLVIPEGFKGKPVVFEAKTGREHAWDSINPQFKFFVNGELTHGLDINHREVIITEEAIGGEIIPIALQAHSGMDDILVDLKTKISVLETKVEELYYNLKVPSEVIDLLPEDDKRRIDMLKLLNSALTIVDFRRPFSKEFYETIEEANTFLETNLYNAELWHEDIIAHCIGHTHIDIAWRWTIDQTRQKVVRSFATALNLMKKYPEYIFFSSQPQLYQFVKEEAPQLYHEIKERIREGRWEADGAMWVEPDCNLISGESLVRQILFGTRFFQREFGVENKILWLPDVFGYSAAMPQILKKCGIDYFITSKLSWNEYNKVPYDTFMWRGIDGSEVLTHFIMNREYQSEPDGFYTAYGGMLTPSQVAGGWQRYQQKSLNSEVLHPYGYGDGGGGPTKEMLENARRLEKGIPGVPKVRMGKAVEFLKKLESEVKGNLGLPKWVGELYLEYHRGTYTSMAKNKKYNRRSEFLYENIEWLSSLNMLMNTGFNYPTEQLNKGWELILLNQFHDILPGSSIEAVYKTSHKQYEEVISEGNRMLAEAINSLAAKINLKEKSVIVFNSLSFEVTDIASLELEEDHRRFEIYSFDGEKVATQVVKEEDEEGNELIKLIFLAERVPAKGYKTYIIKEAETSEKTDTSLFVSSSLLSNDFLDIEIDDNGNLCSIYDKLQKRQLLKEGMSGNVFQAFEDKPIIFDAWDINMYYTEKMWEINQVESVEVIEEGPIRSGIKLIKQFMDSVIEQNIYLYRHSSRVDFKTKINWKEKQILLKTAFPLDINTDKATYEIQYGNVERPTHSNTSWDAAKFEVCAHKWADISEDGYGVALLNDCKYGYDIKDSVMRLSLIKSPIYPNPHSDQGIHYFTYSLYPHAGSFKEAEVIKEAYILNNPFYAKVEEAHSGQLSEQFSLIALNAENVVVEVVKKAEDSNHIIVRAYEAHNRRTKVTLNLGIAIAEVMECNPLEKEIERLEVQLNSFEFEIKPFEVKTFKIKFL